jgi:uncharacterized hydantoinase/oxoprolinase family protein
LGAIGVPFGELLAAAFITNFPFAMWWTYLGSTTKDIVEILDGKAVQGPTALVRDNPAALAVIAVVAVTVALKLQQAGKREWAKAEGLLDSQKSK